MAIPIITPIIYPSAAEFWASGFPARYDYAYNSRQLTSLPPEYRVDASAALWAAEQLSLSTPLTLLSNTVNRGHTGKHYITRGQKAPLPPDSFFQIPNSQIYVACPELTFLQAARHLGRVELVELSFDLCAQYYTDANEKFGQAGRTILTTAEQIAAYAVSCNHMHGSTKAIRAVKYVLDSSNSPMETKLAIILILPVRVGGYGLPLPEMNGGIKLGPKGRQLMGVAELRGDLVWRKQRVAVEYNSKAAHNNDAAFYNDQNRATAIRARGWQYIGVSPDNIHTFLAMENIAAIIRQQLGLPAKTELLESYVKERQEVYSTLFR